MEERVIISLLIDLYGKLLTEKQRNIMDMYYNEDLSLAEISEIAIVSRQAVFDIVKRCEKTLRDYENKLNLLHIKIKDNKIKEEILLKLSIINSTTSDKNILSLSKDIENNLFEIGKEV